MLQFVAIARQTYTEGDAMHAPPRSPAEVFQRQAQLRHAAATRIAGFLEDFIHIEADYGISIEEYLAGLVRPYRDNGSWADGFALMVRDSPDTVTARAHSEFWKVLLL